MSAWLNQNCLNDEVGWKDMARTPCQVNFIGFSIEILILFRSGIFERALANNQKIYTQFKLSYHGCTWIYKT